VKDSPFDRWLERPYLEAARRVQEYESFCEENDLNFDDPKSEEAFLKLEAELEIEINEEALAQDDEEK
jgi:hypothetical protein